MKQLLGQISMITSMIFMLVLGLKCHCPSCHAGLLFTRINLDTFEAACDAAMADLADFLRRPSVHRMHLCKESARAPSLFMQLAIMALFTAWAGSGSATAADVLPG